MSLRKHIPVGPVGAIAIAGGTPDSATADATDEQGIPSSKSNPNVLQ